IIKRGSEVKMKKIDWLWPGWLARGKFHILAGAKSAGKSTIIADLMAPHTAGTTWPDGQPAPLGNVLAGSGEDGMDDTIMPRFCAAGGDRDRIFFPSDTIIEGKTRAFDPGDDIEPLMRAIAALPEISLVTIDPVVLAIPRQVDSHKNAESRRG